MNHETNTKAVLEVEGSSGLQSEDQTILIGGGAGLDMDHGETIARRKHQVAQAKTTHTTAQQ
jgi:hypothetical protein